MPTLILLEVAFLALPVINANEDTETTTRQPLILLYTY